MACIFTPQVTSCLFLNTMAYMENASFITTHDNGLNIQMIIGCIHFYSQFELVKRPFKTNVVCTRLKGSWSTYN